MVEGGHFVMRGTMDCGGAMDLLVGVRRGVMLRELDECGLAAMSVERR